MCDTFSWQTVGNGWTHKPNAWDTVRDFERCVADYAGAPYAVAVDSCTNALFLLLRYQYMRFGRLTYDVPKRTYVGVAQAVKNAGHDIRFHDRPWRGAYHMGHGIIDSARRFSRGMFDRSYGGWHCLSFHYAKHLPIGRGGMILLNEGDVANTLRRMRYDGRREGVKPTDDTFDVPGYHMTLEPELAARGLALMHSMPDHNEDLPNDDYADLSQFPLFTEGL
jgi:dTDP-4-amino-4,6-dideoxygalactose transaminase